jgi:bifunctional DNA-binding transcriptional regulator/antitoxin component of YhaV-PrlF toxin-antitoxin module
MTYLELNESGNLVIPRKLLRKSGFELMDRVRVEIAEGKMVLERESPKEDIDRVLDALFAKGVLEPDGLDERLKPNVTRIVTFEELDEMFKGKSLPVEDIIRHERENREA